MKKFRVSLFGESYTLVSDERDEHVAAVVNHVDALMRDIAHQTNLADVKRIAVLTAIKLANEVMHAQSALSQIHHNEWQLLDRLERDLSSVL